MATPPANTVPASVPALTPTANVAPTRFSAGPLLRTRTTHFIRLCGCAAMLDTPDLLKIIICQLDIAALLRLYRTSKYFRSFIEASIPIKKKLCLAPDPEELVLKNSFLFAINTKDSHRVPSARPVWSLDMHTNPLNPLPPIDLRAKMILMQPTNRRVRVRLT